jgi:high-affinity iron transporter
MIILREGVEAILIITAIIAYLLKTDNADKLKIIYNGCITALVMSVLTAVLVKWVFKASAASQEVLEGATMLLASAVLFSVSYWLISKAEAQKWMSYIKDKVGSSLSSNSMRALWFAAFLAVYREGAETVLFYQALASDSTASGLTAIGGGFAIGSILLVGIYLGMRYGAVRLPIRPFFLITGALLYYMAFVFAGKGVMELISGKLFEPSLISWIPTISFIGVYPYLQTLIPQFLIILAAIVGLAVMARQRSVSVRRHRKNG